MLRFVRMRFRESCRVVAMSATVIFAMSLACTNVATDKGPEAQGRGVMQGDPMASAESSSGAVQPSTENEGEPGLCDGVLCDDSVVPEVDALEDPIGAQASPAEGDRTAVRWLPSEAANACRLLLDDAGSGLTEQDIVVQFYADAEGDAPPVDVAWTPSGDCSPMDTVLLPLDGAVSTPHDAETSLDASSALPADGGGFDAGTLTKSETADASAPFTTTKVPRIVDLADEGVYLVQSSDGTWLELCPNACHTVGAQNGLLLLSLPYSVRPAGAR